MTSKTFLLTGEDDYSITRALEDFKNSLEAGDLLDANYTFVDAETIKPQDLELIVSATPFLAPKRLVVVVNLFERFEKQPRRAKKRNKKSQDVDEDIVSFARIIENKPGSTELVVVAGTLSGGNSLLEILDKNIENRAYPLLAGAKLTEWIARLVHSKGGVITPDAAQMLSRQIGSDLWTMCNEIEKLVLYTDGDKITSETINRMVSITPEANIFHMIDAVVAGRSSVAELELEKLLSNGISPSQVINMLARQIRMIAISQDMLTSGFKDSDIRKRLGIKHDFVMQKILQKTRVFNLHAIYSFYLQLVKAEMDIKTGRLEPDLALSVLVEKIAKLN